MNPINVGMDETRRALTGTTLNRTRMSTSDSTEKTKSNHRDAEYTEFIVMKENSVLSVALW